MNEDRIKGSWKEFRGKVKRKWGELTDDELDKIDGSRQELSGAIQKRYGQGKDEVEKQIRDLENE